MIPSTMPTAIADFFNWLADSANGGIEVADLEAQHANAVKIRLGEYRNHGQSRQFTIGGHSVGLELSHIVKLSGDDKLVTFTGTGASRSFTMPTAPTFPLDHPLSRVEERADIKTDTDQATLERILDDFRGRGSEAESASRIDARQWAQKFAALSTQQRNALAVNLNQITEVPTGFPTSDIATFKRILGYFFTYRPDGAYYAKGVVAAGAFPTGVTVEYIQQNHREIELTQGQLCVVIRGARKMWDSNATDHTVGREVVYRLHDRGAGAGDGPRFVPLELSKIQVRLATAGQSVPPTYHFGFFYAVDGVGPNFTEEARPRVSGDLATLLASLPADSTGRQGFIDDPDEPVVGTASAPRLLMIGTLAANATLGTLPQGVEAAGTGRMRTFSCPVDKLGELAAVSGLLDLTLAVRLEEYMTQTRAQVNLPTFLTNHARTAANAGTGVIIGIVDGGFDIGHAAFLNSAGTSRVLAAWDQSAAGGQTPRQRAAPADQANYAGMTYGREYQRADAGFINTTVGSPGHGTHVASIAGGTAFNGTFFQNGTAPGVAHSWPGGLAQGSEFVFVGTGLARGFATDVSDGVRYCLEKARKAGKPCVINISLGVHRHAHDGTDALSRLLTEQVLVSTTSTGTGGAFERVLPPEAFAPGKIICAAAGNDRARDNHIKVDITPGQSAEIRVALRSARNLGTFWAHGASGLPVDLEVEVWDPTDIFTQLLNHTTPVRRGPSNVPTFETFFDNTRIGVSNGPQRPNQHYNIEVLWAVDNAVWSAGNGRGWVIKFKNHGRETVTLHGWESIQRRFLSFVHPSTAIAQTHRTHLVGTPGTAIGTISVAALARNPPSAGQPIPISSFSSPGPLRATTGRMAVDVAAPGSAIVAARARTTAGQANNQLVNKSGTSMASPVVTGFVALLLEQDNTLTTGQLRSLLAATSNTTGNPPVNDFGTGRLDIGAVTVATLNQHTD